MREKILEELNKIEIFDPHTHLDSAHLSARGLHDIMLYHMLISELYSAGCKSGNRLSEEPSDEEIESRIEEAIPFLPMIENTSLYYGMTMILKDLYGITEKITKHNWRSMHEIIKAKFQDKSWANKIFEMSNVKRAVTELWRRKDGSRDNLLSYSLEWAFFARCQWGQFDTALLELEYAWEQEEPGAPLPVTASEIVIKKPIKTIKDIQDALAHYCSKIPYDEIVSTAQHISTDICFKHVTDEEMQLALDNRKNAGSVERDIYASYIFEKFLLEFEKHCGDVVFHFSLGAEPLPFETGSKLRSETVFEVSEILVRHPNIKFQVMLSNAHQNQAICTLARECPNLSVAGYWWHSFFPTFIERVIAERLDMLPMNKQVGFFSDAYCADWLYAKSIIVKKQLAKVLDEKIKVGQYDFEQAIEVANNILNKTPKNMFKF